MTPKTFPKYIAKVKKLFAENGWSMEQYEAALEYLKDEVADEYSAGKFSKADYVDAVGKINNAKNKPGLNGQQVTAGSSSQPPLSKDQLKQMITGLDAKAKPVKVPMSVSESEELVKQLQKKVSAGHITPDEYQEYLNKLSQMMLNKATLAQATSALGLDQGAKATETAGEKLEKEIKKVYGAAAKEMQGQLDEWTQKFGKELKEYQAKVASGEMTQADFSAWLKSQTMLSKILDDKIDIATGTMLDANKVAIGMVNGSQVGVFAENANYQAYQITQDTGMNLAFTVYDTQTAKVLLKDKPELIPRKEVNGKKDKAWNKDKIAGAVARALIQGESIPKLARRIATETASTNMKSMIRYARTAMTSAQNAGRMEVLHQAQGMGIKCRKQWLATLDHRTRDAHAKMDGQTVGVDEPFKSDFGDIMFPGDTGSKGSVPANLYNCRCTMVYIYDDYPADPTQDMRRDNETGEEIIDMNYQEWKAAKEGSQLNTLNFAKTELAEAQKAVVKAKINESKVYEGIWKDPVTLADYADKKGAIQAKRDYYTAEIQKYKDAQAAGSSWATDDKINELVKKRKLLDDFEKKGQLIEKRDAALNKVKDVYAQIGYAGQAAAPAVMQTAKKQAKKASSAKGGGNASPAPAQGQSVPQDTGKAGSPFNPDAYTQERLDKALWTSDQKKVDSMMRARTGEVWRNAPEGERKAIYEYTQSFSKFNEPLRGIEYGTNKYKGVGNTDLNAGARHNGPILNRMTDIISKCSYDHDMWLQRSTGYNGMEKFFQCSENLLRNGTQKQLDNELLGKTVTEYGFMSMGSAKGKGFSGNILLNIYAPSGTKMMYAEPFSAYSGSYDHLNWDGVSKQSRFGQEFETIMQQGTQFRVAKIERSGSKIYVDLHVINQLPPQRYKP